MQFIQNASLKDFNTFGIEAFAERLVEVRSEKELKEALSSPVRPLYILGEGSNILITQNLPGLVIVNRIKGKKVLEQTGNRALVEAGGGENWHALVEWTLEQGLSGIENLSLIPGTAGAAPMQNIGAYGVEIKEVFHSLSAIHIDTRTRHTFFKKSCRFGYRDSIFKGALKGKYVITRVKLELSKTPQVNTSYGAIQDTLRSWGIDKPGPADVSRAVIHIRSSKLPDPKELGNSGSFFKNPEIKTEYLEELKKQFPHIVSFPLPGGKAKVPAGWLIEQCGWKGKKVGRTGAHAKQALVLVNYGGASGKEVLELADAIARSVNEKFGIHLEREVNVL